MVILFDYKKIFNGEFHGLDRTRGQTLEEELADIGFYYFYYFYSKSRFYLLSLLQNYIYLFYDIKGGEWNIDRIWESWGCAEGLDLNFESFNAKVLGQPQYQRILREFEVALRAQV